MKLYLLGFIGLLILSITLGVLIGDHTIDNSQFYYKDIAGIKKQADQKQTQIVVAQ